MMRWFSYLVMRGVVWVTRLLFADINISFSTALHRSKARLGRGGFLSSFSFCFFFLRFSLTFPTVCLTIPYFLACTFFSSRNPVCCIDILGLARRTFIEMGIVSFKRF